MRATHRSYPPELLGPLVRQCATCKRLILFGSAFADVLKAKLANSKKIEYRDYLQSIAFHFEHSYFINCYICYNLELAENNDISIEGRIEIRRRIELVIALYESPEYQAIADRQADLLDRQLAQRQQLPIACFAERSV